MMNQTIETAREALRLAQSTEEKAAAALRQADNALALVHDGLPGDPVRGAEALAEAHATFQKRHDEYSRASLAVLAAESALVAAANADAEAAQAATAPKMASPEEIAEAHAEALRAMADARAERTAAETRADEILEKLRACDAEHARLVKTAGDDDKQAAAMARLAGTREILLGRKPLAEAAKAEAVELHARAARDVMGFTNPAARIEVEAATAAMTDARLALARLPMARLVAAVTSAREAVDNAQGPADYADKAEAYAARLAALRDPIREQAAAVRAMLEGIGKTLAQLDAVASHSLAE
jgi:hypothetical protein